MSSEIGEKMAGSSALLTGGFGIEQSAEGIDSGSKTSLLGAGAEIRTGQVESGSSQMRAGDPHLFLKTPTANAFAAFSPDGIWLAYGDAEAGRYGVYVQAFLDNDNQVQISNADGTWSMWSRNGHELFYRTED